MSDDLKESEDLEQELPPEIEQKRRKGLLRTGYTTGTCATAATKAALISMIRNKPINEVVIILPKGNTAKLMIERCNFDSERAECAVIKDAGDDPDVTHGAEIVSTVTWIDNVGEIEIYGGKGGSKEADAEI